MYSRFTSSFFDPTVPAASSRDPDASSRETVYRMSSHDFKAVVEDVVKRKKEPGWAEWTVKLLTDAMTVSNAAIPLGGKLTEATIKVSWKATKLLSKISLLGIGLYTVGQLGSGAINMADTAIKAANWGVILLGVAGGAFFAYEGVRYVKNNVEDIATTAKEKAILYLKPKEKSSKTQKQKAESPISLLPSSSANRPRGQGIDSRELMMRQMFGGADDS